MTPSEIELGLTIFTAEDVDADTLDEMTIRLMRDLRDLGIESVERPSGGTLPEGAKGDPFTLGALALVAAPAFLPNLVEFLQAWSLRGESRKVKIKTPAGLEVDFTPEKKLSGAELLELADKLAQVSTKGGAAGYEPVEW